MSHRDAKRHVFLASTDWKDAKLAAITGDASDRRYARLTGGPQPALLMDAPPDLDLKTDRFMEIADHLRSIGLSAPEIYASDLRHGFLIIEDLGTALVHERRSQRREAERTLYAKLCDIALHLWANPPPFFLPRYEAREMTAQLGLFADWYCAKTPGSDASAGRDLIRALSARLAALSAAKGMIHRDYHVQNLLVLPGRTGLAGIGIIDFQDAMLGPQSYDIASLLTDARQDVPADLRREMLDYVQQKMGRNAEALSLEFALCALVRNLRILGIFTRLALRDGKAQYPPLMPRVFGYVQDALQHPRLATLTPLFERAAAAPTPALIAALQSRSRPA